MARHGAAGFEAAQIAALSTRRRKDRNVRPEQLVSEWRERAIGHGLHEWRIERICRRGRVPEQPDWVERFARMAGPDGLTRDRSTFGRRDVIQALSSAANEGATVEIHPLRGRRIPRRPERRPTSRLAGSRRRAAVLDPGAARDREPGPGRCQRAFEHPAAAWSRPRVVDAAIGRRTVPRRRAARAWCAGSLRTATACRVVIGLAGTGKTTALAAAREAWDAVGCAGPRLRARAQGRARARAEGRPSRYERRRACSTDRAALPDGHRAGRRRGRDARHPRPREAAGSRRRRPREARPRRRRQPAAIDPGRRRARRL